MRRIELTEKEKKELKQLSGKERERIKKFLGYGLARPRMRDDIDVSLMTFKESELEKKCAVEHKRIVRKRAEELRFSPDTLSEEEWDATFECLTYEELKPFWKAGELYEKNWRLQENLSLMEKINVRIYHGLTLHFSEFGPCFERNLEDIEIGLLTERYFSIMRRHGERIYENPYYFLTPEHKKRVLEAYAKVISEKGETKRELHTTRLKDNRENKSLPKEEGVP